MLRVIASRYPRKALSNIRSQTPAFSTFSSIGAQFQLRTKATEQKILMERDPSNENVLAYLRTLNQFEPQQTVTAIERGWETGKIPVTDAFIKEYLKGVSSLGRLDSMSIPALLATINKHNPSGSIDLRAALTPHLNSSAGPLLAAGMSSTQPMYVSQVKEEVTFKSFIKNLLIKTVTVVGFVILVSALFSEDGSNKAGSAGGGSGGMGGIASRFGLPGGSIVKQAEKSDKTFDDVVGIDEAKADLQEIVLYLKDPSRFTRLGGKLPKGVLLTGPPGNGKTLLARAIAGEASVPFYHTSGSEFEEMYVGVGAKRVRELFEVARQNSPCIIFIDEIDAIGGARQLKDASAMKMTLNQLLVEMDGFAQNNGIIVIAATNFPDSLDKALVRPGRLDKHVDVPMPDIGGRKAILELYGSKVPMDTDVSMEQLARGTPGFSGAELFNLVNQAALKASVDGLKSVGMSALEWAKDKIMMGSERKSAVISPETMRMTAFHEAGHALVALKTDGSNPIHKATIMPRGRALGMVMQLPDGDQVSQSRKQMLAYLDVCMGGRVAEELIYGNANVTSGASSDIQQATRLARAMVTQYGFSDKVGIMFIDEQNGKQSGETQKFIDDEVRELLNASYNRAKQLLETNRKELDLIAHGLMEYESLSGHEIVELTQGKPLNMIKRSQKPSRPIKEIITPPTVAKKSSLHIPVIPVGKPVANAAVETKPTPVAQPSATVVKPAPTTAPTVAATPAAVAPKPTTSTVAATNSNASSVATGLFGSLGYRGQAKTAEPTPVVVNGATTTNNNNNKSAAVTPSTTKDATKPPVATAATATAAPTTESAAKTNTPPKSQ